MSEHQYTTEDVEEAFCCGAHSLIATDHAAEDARTAKVFRNWLAAHDREIAAQALEEAAVCVTGDVWVADSTKPRGGLYWGASEWLNHLAAQKRGA